MTIPEDQLVTWAKQGTVPQSAATYATIKKALESSPATYTDRSFEVFLQGSYKNDTNVWAESDVDVIINLTDIFYYELDSLTPQEREAFKTETSPASYTLADFKKSVVGWLEQELGHDVDPCEKAVLVKARHNRRNADIIISANHREYTSYKPGDVHYYPGICFHNTKGDKIVNYPKQHSDNVSRKHQDTNGELKPLIRIIKNMRNRMVSDGLIEDGLAPSYYLEGLLYNVPSENFGGTYQKSFSNVVDWLLQADRSKFLCANECYYLFHPTSLVTWRAEKCAEFLSALADYWNKWD